jgi:hypothetical protein
LSRNARQVLGEIDAELEQLTVNPRSAPEGIGARHSTNQFTDFRSYRWPAASVSALPSPVILEAFPVPSDHGPRLDDDKALSPSVPGAGEPQPEDTVSLQQAWVSGPPAENDQLLAEGQFLCNEASVLGKENSNDSPDDSEQEHRHLKSSEIGIGAGVYSGWLKCQNLKAGRGYW